jgi:hypothetical protein
MGTGNPGFSMAQLQQHTETSENMTQSGSMTEHSNAVRYMLWKHGQGLSHRSVCNEILTGSLSP